MYKRKNVLTKSIRVYRNMLPPIGLLLTGGDILSRCNQKYNRYTTPQYIKTGYCLNCGAPFWAVITNNKHIVKFCSRDCTCKYYSRKLKENNFKIAYKNTDRKELSEFYQKYTGFIISEIGKYDSTYTSEALGWWGEYSVRFLYKFNSPAFKNITDKSKLKYLAKAVYCWFFNTKKKHGREVFYDECSLKTQEMILGDYNSR